MYILFDIGGTKTRVAYSKDGLSFKEPLVCNTEKDFSTALTTMVELFRKAAAGGSVKAAAGGVRALDRDKKKLRPHPHYPLWVGEPLHEELEKMLGVPVYLENDAALAGLGEAVVGAGQGFPIVAYLTVSTGVGGARIINGAVDFSAQGFEPGNQIIDMDGSSHFAGTTPAFLENYISGVAFTERFGKKPHEISDPTIWDETARVLAYGLHNTIVHWSPDVVVLGGSMVTGNPAISVERIEEYLKSILKIFPALPVIKKAELGDRGGLQGALAYLSSKHTLL